MIDPVKQWNSEWDREAIRAEEDRLERQKRAALTLRVADADDVDDFMTDFAATPSAIKTLAELIKSKDEAAIGAFIVKKWTAFVYDQEGI